MSLQIYKPNKSNTGFAFSFYMGEDRKTKLPILFLNAIAQHSWDDKIRIGSFSGNKENPEKNLSIKFNEFEVGASISAIFLSPFRLYFLCISSLFLFILVKKKAWLKN